LGKTLFNGGRFRRYEAGLPAWSVTLPTYGFFYRRQMRSILTGLIIVIQLISMICGFYDLYRNIPYIEDYMAFVFDPLYRLVVAPIGGALSWVVGGTVTGVFNSVGSIFSSVYQVFSYLFWVVSPVVTGTMLIFQPLVRLGAACRAQRF
jgi:hypothetical protein